MNTGKAFKNFKKINAPYGAPSSRYQSIGQSGFLRALFKLRATKLHPGAFYVFQIAEYESAISILKWLDWLLLLTIFGFSKRNLCNAEKINFRFFCLNTLFMVP